MLTSMDYLNKNSIFKKKYWMRFSKTVRKQSDDCPSLDVYTEVFSEKFKF